MVEVSHPGPVRLPQHTHETAFLCLLLEGSYRETFGHTTLAYVPFTLAYHPPTLTHQDTIGGSGGRLFTIEIDTARTTSAWDDAMRLVGPPGEVRNARAVGLMCRLYRTYAGGLESHLPPNALHVESLALELLAVATGASSLKESRRPAWIGRVVDSLHECRFDTPSVTTLAADAGVHPVHLARVFRRVHGCTTGQYQARLRVRRACALLASTDRSLAHIAAETGFADQSHLTRVFGSVIGCPPGAFRRLLRPAATPES